MDLYFPCDWYIHIYIAGDYSNAKLLFTYGFVIPRNEPRGIDFWLRCQPDDPLVQQKSGILKSHPMTANQTYDFRGTLRRDRISLALLTTVRIVQLRSEEQLLELAAQAFQPKPINKEHELACYQAIIAACERKLDMGNQFRAVRNKDNGKCSKDKLDAAFRVHHDDAVVLQDTIATLVQWSAALEADPANFVPRVY
jgi:hypothetical protein